MFQKIKKILRDSCGASFPMAIAIVLILIIFLCGISEYYRLQIIASGVREAVEDALISTVNDNYAGVYHGVREGYSGGYMPNDAEDWKEALDEGDIYAYLDHVLGTQSKDGRHVKYAGENQQLEFAIDRLDVTIRNAPLAPSDPRNAQRFEANATVRLEVPVRFGGKSILPMVILLKAQAGYIEVF